LVVWLGLLSFELAAARPVLLKAGAPLWAGAERRAPGA